MKLKKAALVGVLTVVMYGCSGGDGTTDAESATTTTAAPAATTTAAPTTTLDEEAAAAAALLGETEALITAIDSGDVDTVMSMVQVSAPEPTRLTHGFWAAWDFADYRDCEVITAIGFGRRVDCVLTFTDPVFRQLDPDEQVVSFNFWDDGVTWQRSGRSPDTFTAYREFFEANEPDLYAATCVPDAYDQPVDSYNGFALTPDCGAILQSKGADVAAWLDAGGAGE